MLLLMERVLERIRVSRVQSRPVFLPVLSTHVYSIAILTKWVREEVFFALFLLMFEVMTMMTSSFPRVRWTLRTRWTLWMFLSSRLHYSSPTQSLCGWRERDEGNSQRDEQMGVPFTPRTVNLWLGLGLMMMKTGSLNASCASCASYASSYSVLLFKIKMREKKEQEEGKREDIAL